MISTGFTRALQFALVLVWLTVPALVSAGDDDFSFQKRRIEHLQKMARQLEFSTALIGGGFQFVNPNATSTCSCGTSFSA